MSMRDALPCIILIASAASHAGVGDVQCEPGGVIFGVYGERRVATPSGIPYGCYPATAALQDKWKRADDADWQRIANEYCSHKNGWIEINPGTCSAGGPPPICTADHWVRDDRAIQKWRLLMCRLRATRTDEMSSTVCDCAVGQMRALRSQAAPASTYGLACRSTTDCPPGMSCRDDTRRCSLNSAPSTSSFDPLKYPIRKLSELALSSKDLVRSFDCDEQTLAIVQVFALPETYDLGTAWSDVVYHVENLQREIQKLNDATRAARAGQSVQFGSRTLLANVADWRARLTEAMNRARAPHNTAFTQPSRNTCLNALAAGFSEAESVVGALMTMSLDTTGLPEVGTSGR
jgi:hypothetical protein